jgi:hypothetical protein
MKILRIFVLIIGLAVLADAQAAKETTVLKGVVYDDGGAIIEGANVTFRGGDNKSLLVKTNADGVFEINLKAGNYSIQVEYPGFQVFKLEKYRVAPSYKGEMNLDIVLEVRPCDDCHWIDAEPVKSNKKP